MKPTKEDIQTAIGKISSLLEDVSHQAKCIEGELDYENHDLRLDDMWDCNDLGNWTSMEVNLEEVKEILMKIIPHV